MTSISIGEGLQKFNNGVFLCIGQLEITEFTGIHIDRHFRASAISPGHSMPLRL